MGRIPIYNSDPKEVGCFVICGKRKRSYLRVRSHSNKMITDNLLYYLQLECGGNTT